MLSKEVIKKLKEELGNLETIIRKAEKELSRAPEGCLLVKKHRNRVQYYFRIDPKDRNGKYIPTSEKKKVEALAQKAYNKKVLAAARKQYDAIGSFLNRFDSGALPDIFAKEGEVRQRLVKPCELPDLQYIKEWISMPYEGKTFREDVPVQYTQKGEQVRSKSEVIIANALYRAGIPYRYECPLRLGDRVIYPDFTILRMKDRKEIFWEHLGLVDDTEYRNHALHRIREYEAYGIWPGDNLIITVENNRHQLNADIVERMIRHYI